MLFQLKLTSKFISLLKGYTHRCNSTGVYSLSFSCGEEWCSYIHKTSKEELKWLSNVAAFYVRAVNGKNIDNESIRNVFFHEFADLAVLLDSDIAFKKTKLSILKYKPITNGNFINKRLVALKQNANTYYLCEPYFFKSKNDIEFDKIIFNDSEIEETFRELIVFLTKNKMIERIEIKSVDDILRETF